MTIMEPQGIERALVVGAGVMGHAIAQVFAQAGIDVDLVDLDKGALTRAMALIPSNLATLAEFGQVPGDQIPEILARIRPSTDLTTAATSVGFVMEAVSELPEIKQRVFSQLDELCPPHTILASTTSSLNIFKIAPIKRPERLVAAHWFAPPHIIPLVEVVGGPDTASPVVTATAELMRRLGKRPLVLKQFIPAFIVNRIQNGIARAVWEMLEQGWATPEQIDLAVKTSLGVRLPIVGVVQTMDFTGLDVVADIMRGRGGVTPIIEEKVKQGHLGAKTSKGLYDYGGRSEAEILHKRDSQYLKMLEHLEGIEAFDPI
jgi:3-hydroxybutyryl-CoA dehydrogenase